MQIKSPAFQHHQEIPSKYTCEGENVSPSLVFQDIPPLTKSLALIMDDPDAPKGIFVHWVVWNLPPEGLVLEEGVKVLRQGVNHYGKKHYMGPCPPPGKPHRYFFKLYALDTLINLPEGSSKEQLEEAMEGHILGKAEIIGIYERFN